MKESSFKIAALVVVLSLVLLVAIEAVWSVRTYRNMRDSYELQICSVLEEAAWRYTTPTINDNVSINIGNISRFEALVGEGLRAAGLDTDYRVEVLSTTDSEPIVLMAMGDIDPTRRVISVDKHLNPLILRLKVHDPHATILSRMCWIVVLQILSVLLLTVTFIYLLRTIFRAKEVDRIRRDLTHNITHELKTPIAAAHAATEALRTMPAIVEDRDTRNDYLDMALKELHRLDDMVEEILRSATEEFATAELRLEECDLRDMLHAVCDTLQLRYAARNIEWHVDISSDCSVVADSFHLKGALTAIIDNAIKYSPESPIVAIRASIERAFVYVDIEDNGIGIPRSEHRHVFEKFHRVRTADGYTTSGYGVGLYYARSVARRHGGDITLYSAVGRGSRFRIRLPRYGK